MVVEPACIRLERAGQDPWTALFRHSTGSVMGRHLRSARWPGGRPPEARLSQLHWQDHHRHVSQMEPAQHRECRFTVQLTNIPIVVLEYELAGEKNAVWKFLVNLLSKLGQLFNRV